MSAQQKMQLSQNVFKNADKRWISAVVDMNGEAYLHDHPANELTINGLIWTNKKNTGKWKLVGDGFDTANWRDSAIDRAINWDMAAEDRERAVIARFDTETQRKLEHAKEELRQLELLVKLQEEQLGDFERNESQFVEIISEVLQSLHAADPNARVSLTSEQLLKLLTHVYHEDNDLPFF